MPAQTVSSQTALSSVASSADAVQLLPANKLRQGATVTNESTQDLYLALGSASVVSSTNYTVLMVGGSTANGYAYYELPFTFQGEVWGIWASANGSARITEMY